MDSHSSQASQGAPEDKKLDIMEPSAAPKQHSARKISFLDFPREIRDKVYEYSLLTKYVEEKGPKTAVASPDNANAFLNTLTIDEAPDAGNITVANSTSQKFHHNVALLRINRQVHKEASCIWNKNQWILMKINRLGLATDLQLLGFPAKRALSYKPAVKAALSITMQINDADTQYERFVMPRCAQEDLQRVILGTGGRCKLTVCFEKKRANMWDVDYTRAFLEPGSKQIMRLEGYTRDAYGRKRRFFDTINYNGQYTDIFCPGIEAAFYGVA